jgi:centromere protein I
LEEIEDVHNFVQKLEKIEPPNQLVAVIGDSLLQKFLQLRSSESSSRRVDAWLLAFFEDQLEVPESAESKILEMLEAVLIYTRYTKVWPEDDSTRTCHSYPLEIAPCLPQIPKLNVLSLEWHHRS